MGNLAGFNANDHEPTQAFEPLPAGDYSVVIAASEFVATKAGDGQMLKLELEVIDGEHKGRRLFDRLCLSHPNPTAVQIARGTLSAICRAVGVLTPDDSAHLHNKPMTARVKLKPRSDTGEMANEIGGYKPAAKVGGTGGSGWSPSTGNKPAAAAATSTSKAAWE